MGQLVAARARQEGHSLGTAVTSEHASFSPERLAELLKGHDAAIDFTIADAVVRNVEACALAGVPLVEGTTGWNKHVDEARKIVERHNGALVYGANFSIGVNLFYRIVAHASELFATVGDYEVFIEEAHHSRKRDAPSGTALRLRDIVGERFTHEITVASTRAGHIPGTHRVGFDGIADQVTLTHTARSREGFAAGAVLAARWIQGKKGMFEFSQMFDEIVGRNF
jgi:4-hydroxy-tetrahydrodipicolinate reductase